MTVLPPGVTEDAFTTVCQDEAALRPGVGRLCQRLGVDISGLTRFAAGSRPVYASGNLVLKLFPPVDLAGCPASRWTPCGTGPPRTDTCGQVTSP
ncbi:MAG TPA: hypothetical protein VFV73_31105 [Streptosporangiaceae bacterium]|nr:hypothetical protein [Streptosporangiaceae bacterium]